MRDNLCKYLAEKYPTAFTQWLLQDSSEDVSILKTELNLEPIRADSVTLVQTQNCILHLEFQVEPEPTLPLRMLDYWLRLYRNYQCEIVQVLILLRRTRVHVPDVFELPTTIHRYRVVKLWEEDPTQFFNIPALLPFAVLGKTDNEEALLQIVANQIDQIESEQSRQELSTIIQLLAGLQYSKELIETIFREGMMRESVIYQEILQEGERKGRQEGEQLGLQRGRQEGQLEGECTLILRQLHRRLGTLPDGVISQIHGLSLEQLESLGEALLDFQDFHDLETWLGSQR
ncbi:Rpn family recombination-promoting nuclease/putative transposase [Candidatus Synechococcus calcipolaris G9]|uniref:Rpn family recombination-promoting nuclease/putative transposase n=1 Tax=Candidatus Synechococcus calcipolaris G9 TaxID=1497997 RepID=A0ABT6F0X5_9SYNE|nr:Rpn family recombination-promoting nuclease/putative transposase [Candidatus Synechococcus calcipolaris]MDG2991509.1 Rpn family recombination-promoting nuclease/putative transposase [Candidatus Synechococcus calcipolaris G9]